LDTSAFDLVIAVDWSAAQGRSERPRADRCWLAWGGGTHRPEPEYAPTRLEAETRIRDLIAGAGCERVLLAIDVAIGFPTADDGAPVLSTGRDLVRGIASMIEDDERGRNNRFDVAAALNQRIAKASGKAVGPFWGRPGTVELRDVPRARPDDTGVRRLRACEHAARAAGLPAPKSPWQLAGAGAVGSQSLMAMPMLDRLLWKPPGGAPASLWPFEPSGDGLTIAEMYPSMFEGDEQPGAIKDARQVAAARDALLDRGFAMSVDHPLARVEGWILGVPNPA